MRILSSKTVSLQSLLVLAFLVPTQAADVVIRNDGGGFVNQYAEKYVAIRQRGNRVVIDGWCASACTLALGLRKTCVTRRAILGFHKGYTFGWFGTWSEWTDPGLSAYFMSQYPPGIRQWINNHGGLTTNIRVLRGPALAALVPSCK